LPRNFASCSVFAVVQNGLGQWFLGLHFEFMESTSYGATSLFFLLPLLKFLPMFEDRARWCA
jgi:hypothetical protein